MTIGDPSLREPSVLGGVGDGDGFLVERGKRGLVIGRHQDPQAVDAAGAADFIRNAREQIHPVVTREQTGIDHKPGGVAAAKRLLDIGQTFIHDALEFTPVGALRVGVIGAENDIPVGATLLSVLAEAGQKDFVEVAKRNWELVTTTS